MGSAQVTTAPEGGLIKLSDAARLLGCHIETLRLRVRRGELTVRRGAHGTYYLTSAALAEIVPPRRSRTRRVFHPVSLEWSWDLLEQQLPLKGRRRQQALALIALVREKPKVDGRLYRLLSVQRLRAAGLRSSEIALHIGISVRQARRLTGQNLQAGIARAFLREQARQRARAALQARGIVADLQRDLAAAGFQPHRRSRRPAELGFPTDGPVPVFKVRGLNDEAIRHLRDAGLSDEQIEAITLVGIGADELNELILHALGRLLD